MARIIKFNPGEGLQCARLAEKKIHVLLVNSIPPSNPVPAFTRGHNEHVLEGDFGASHYTLVQHANKDLEEALLCRRQ